VGEVNKMQVRIKFGNKRLGLFIYQLVHNSKYKITSMDIYFLFCH